MTLSLFLQLFLRSNELKVKKKGEGVASMRPKNKSEEGRERGGGRRESERDASQ